MKNVFLSGRIANFGQVTNGNSNSEGERNNAFTVRFVNLTLDSKDEETGYNKQAPIKVIAFGRTAERLASFESMEYVVITGKLSKEDDYITSDGQSRQGSWIIVAEMIDNWSKAETEKRFGGNSETKETETKTTKATKKPKMPTKKPSNKRSA